MLKPAGRLAEQGIQELVRAIHHEGRSGELEIVHGGQRRKLQFRRGELFLAASHPLARRLAERLAILQELKSEGASGEGRRAPAEGGGLSARLTEVRLELREVVARIAEVIGEWREGTYEWHPEAGLQATDLVGPLPTASLIMLGAVGGPRDEASLLARLGGERRRWVAASNPRALRDTEQLTPDEAFLVEQLRQPRALRDLVSGGAALGTAVVERLLQLYAAGIVRPEDSAPEEIVPEDLVDEAVLARFEQRIGEGLAAQPGPADLTNRRAQVAELLSRMAGMSHYELLGVEPHASPEEIHAAYDVVARLVHPAQAAALQMAGGERALRLLFETATRAYLTLCHPDRRREYNALIGVATRARVPEASEREEERRLLARQNFERAQSLSARSEFHFAVELLQQAVKADPRPEYFAALGRALAHNPNWLRRAVDALRQATDLAPRDVSYRVELGQLYEQLADPEHARLHYLEAQKLERSNPTVRDALERLSSSGGARGGLLGRLRGR